MHSDTTLGGGGNKAVADASCAGCKPDPIRWPHEDTSQRVVLRTLVDYLSQSTFARDKKPVRQKLAEADLMEHEQGRQVLAGFFIPPGSDVTHCAALDFDDHEERLQWPDMVQAAQTVAARLTAAQIYPFAVRSKGGRGIHLWILFTQPVPARQVRAFLSNILKHCKFIDGEGGVAAGQVEIFPKQDAVPPDGLGNHLTLPFAGQSCVLTAAEGWNEKVSSMPTTSGPAPVLAFANKPDEPPPLRATRKFKFDEALLREALTFLSAERRSRRISVGMAIKNSAVDNDFDDEAAYAIWVDWVKTGHKLFDQRKSRQRWRSIKIKSPDKKRLTLRSIFKKAQEVGWEFPAAAALREMNELYAAGSVKGKFRVIKWVPDTRYPHQRVAEFYSRGDFANAVVNPKIKIAKFDRKGIQVGEEPVGRGAWWLAHDRRREFDGIDYRPGQPAEIEVRDRHNGNMLRILNMYSGFSCEPDFVDSEKKCSLYLAHVRDNIAGGQDDLHAYVVDWMASGVQQPEDPGRSALSLRGDPGAGKGVFATEYGKLWGRHFLHATQREHVTGKFNAHAAETCLIFVDEALYAEILADARILKTLVSETTKLLERKGIDVIEINNYARFIFATNDVHPLQIEHNDRRYCAIYVRNNIAWADEPSEHGRVEKRRAYFKPIRKLAALDEMGGLLFQLSFPLLVIRKLHVGSTLNRS